MACGNPTNDGPRWHVRTYDRACSDDTLLADSGVGKENRACTDPRIVSNSDAAECIAQLTAQTGVVRVRCKHHQHTRSNCHPVANRQSAHCRIQFVHDEEALTDIYLLANMVASAAQSPDADAIQWEVLSQTLADFLAHHSAEPSDRATLCHVHPFS